MSAALFESIEKRLMFARALGIDVSHYNNENSSTKTINWTNVAATKTFVIMKATQNTGNTDAYFASNLAGAKAAGLKVGVYHYGEPDLDDGATYVADAVAEANHFYAVAKNAMGAGFLPPTLDLESGESLSTADLTAWANAFNNRIKSLCGVTPLIYVNGNYAGNVDSTVTQWPLWIANPSNPSNVDTATPNDYQWPTWKFWQYSWTGTVSGISGGVDLDVYNGTVAELNAFIASYSTPQVPAVTVKQDTTTVANNQATPIDFGTIAQGSTGASKTFTISNTGTANLSTSNLVIPSGYTLTDPLNVTIAPGGFDSITVQQNTTTPGTFAGNISFTTNVTGSTTFAFPITGKVLSSDVTPPTMTDASFAYTAATPSLSFAFSENVNASLSITDFVITNDTAGTTVTPSSYSYDAGTNTATLGFAAELANANYTAAIVGSSVNDVAGNAMANSYAFGFFSLVGDINRDRKVDIVDLGMLAGSYGSSTAIFSDGDLNADGRVNIVDLGLLSGNYGKSVGQPAQPDGLRVTSTATSVPVAVTASTVTVPPKNLPPSKGKVTTTLTPISNVVLV